LKLVFFSIQQDHKIKEYAGLMLGLTICIAQQHQEFLRFWDTCIVFCISIHKMMKVFMLLQRCREIHPLTARLIAFYIFFLYAWSMRRKRGKRKTSWQACDFFQRVLNLILQWLFVILSRWPLLPCNYMCTSIKLSWFLPRPSLGFFAAKLHAKNANCLYRGCKQETCFRICLKEEKVPNLPCRCAYVWEI